MLTKQDLSEIQKVIQKEVDPIKIDIKTIKSDISQIRSDIKTVINFFDKEYLELRKRVERIEEHLNLPPGSN
jgi:chromosome segregation ATPase